MICHSYLFVLQPTGEKTVDINSMVLTHPLGINNGDRNGKQTSRGVMRKGYNEGLLEQQISPHTKETDMWSFGMLLYVRMLLHIFFDCIL